MDKVLEIKEYVPLCDFTTLRLGGLARYFTVIDTDTDIIAAVEFARTKNLPIFPLGGGSNLVVSDTLSDMLVVKMENKNLEIISEDSASVLVRVAAGHMWDEFVAWSVENDYSGIAALSAIPGTCGATPVQNVGAYGAEVSRVIESVRVYDIDKKIFRNISNEECNFAYRDSIFKHELKGKCVIESVAYRLFRAEPEIPDYPKVAEVFAEMRKKNPDDSKHLLIRRTIQKIRSEKLPDPKLIANVGSFFKNPFVEKDIFKKLKEKYPDILQFPAGNMVKVPAGWLIETAGLKGFVQNGVAVYDKNALVLINNSAENAEEIFDLAGIIQNKVSELFGISLEIEPEILR